MKGIRFLTAISFFLCSCQKPPIPAPEPTPTPTATPRPTPVATPQPTATPSPTPQARLAPKGTFYVVKGFSITNDGGIYGFPEGRKVVLIKEEAEYFIVSDGNMQGRAPKAYFTNDLDVIERLTQEHAKIRAVLISQAEEGTLAQQKYQSQLHQNRIGDLKEKRNQAWLAQVESLRATRRSLDARLRKAMEERSGGFGFKKGGSIVTYSVDASQIDKLRQAIENIDQQLDALGDSYWRYQK